MSEPGASIEAYHRDGAELMAFRNRILPDHGMLGRIEKRVHFVKEYSCRHRVPHSVESSTVAWLGKTLLTNYLVPFEVASVLLLVVMIGAAYLAKQERN